MNGRGSGEEAPLSLTPRERECLKLSATGRSDEEIAGQLAISCATVRFHIYNACSRLHVGNRRSAIYTAAKAGLI